MNLFLFCSAVWICGALSSFAVQWYFERETERRRKASMRYARVPARCELCDTQKQVLFLRDGGTICVECRKAFKGVRK